jgi:hypothetical protein
MTNNKGGRFVGLPRPFAGCEALLRMCTTATDYSDPVKAIACTASQCCKRIISTKTVEGVTTHLFLLHAASNDIRNQWNDRF